MMFNRSCQICNHQNVCKLWCNIQDSMHNSKMLKIPMGYVFESIARTIGEICIQYGGRDDYDR